MRHVSRTHRVALDWLFGRVNLDSKIRIKYIDTKSQVADIPTKGNFTRDEWNHLLSLFDISHSSSTVCFSAMAKRIQQESGEERVTAKSRPRMNLQARMPSVVSSSTSSTLVKTWNGDEDPGRLVVVSYRSGQPDRFSLAGLWSFLVFSRVEKCGLRRRIGQGNLLKLLGKRCNEFALIMKMLFSTEMRNP